MVEQDARPVAVIRPTERPGRPIDECIAIAKAPGSQASMDQVFADDLKQIVSQRASLDTSLWD